MAQWRQDVKDSNLEEIVKMLRTFRIHFRDQFQGDFPTAQLDLAAIFCDVINVGEAMVNTFSLRASSEEPTCRLVHEGALEALKWLDNHRSKRLTGSKLRESKWEYPVLQAFQTKAPGAPKQLF
jgi:hypothetical protein